MNKVNVMVDDETDAATRPAEDAFDDLAEQLALTSKDQQLLYPDGIRLSYYESAEGQAITKARAMYELACHHCYDSVNLADFHAQLGNHESYNAQELLRFLGY